MKKNTLIFLLIIMFTCSLSAKDSELGIYKDHSIIPDPSDPKYQLTMNLRPGPLYNQARQFLEAGQYVKSIQVLHDILTHNPDFFKNDYVSFYRLYSFERLGFMEFAEKLFEEHIQKYPDSPTSDFKITLRISHAIRFCLPSVDTLWSEFYKNSGIGFSHRLFYYDVAEHFMQNDMPAKALCIYEELYKANYNKRPKESHFNKKVLEKDILLAKLLIQNDHKIKFNKNENPYNTFDYTLLGEAILTTIDLPYSDDTFEKLELLLPALRKYQQFEISEKERWKKLKKRLLKDLN